MKKLATTLMLTCLIFGSPVMAGTGHSHGYAQPPVSQVVAEEYAMKAVASLVKRNKVDNSWSLIKASSVEKKILNGRPEWAVTFVNEKIADVAKQKLYVFLTIGGEFIAANYSGK